MMADKMMALNLDGRILNDDMNSIIMKVQAHVVETMEDAVVKACIETAKAEGVNSLYLLDKRFVLDALNEKIKAKGHGYWLDDCTSIVCSECGAEYSDEIIFMNRNLENENPKYCPNCGTKMDGDPGEEP